MTCTGFQPVTDPSQSPVKQANKANLRDRKWRSEQGNDVRTDSQVLGAA